MTDYHLFHTKHLVVFKTDNSIITKVISYFSTSTLNGV